MSDKPIDENRRLENADLDSHLDEDLRELFDAQSLGPQPTSQELAAWLDGGLDPAQEELLMERIADSPGAMDMALAMRRERRGSQASTSTQPLDADTHRAVDSVMAAISETPMQMQSPSPIERDPGRLPWIAAAMLAMAFAAYTWIGSSELQRRNRVLEDRWEAAQQQVAAQTERIGELSAQLKGSPSSQSQGDLPAGLDEPAEAPVQAEALEGIQAGVQVDLQVVELYASSRLRSGASGASSRVAGAEEDGTRVDLSTSKPAVLILTPQDPIPGAIYGISLLTQNGSPLWQGESSADETGVVLISLPRGFASPGLAWLELTDPGVGVERFGLRFIEQADTEINP